MKDVPLFEPGVRIKKCPQFQYMHKTSLDLMVSMNTYEQRKKVSV